MAAGEPEIPAECRDDSAAGLRAQLGGRIVVRMEGDATPALLRQARAGEIGGVVLFPPAGQDLDALAAGIERLQAAAGESGAAPLVIAVDQEGGEVKRLPSLPPDVDPPELAGDADAAEEQGLATGEALAELGINVDLAPVLDVPESSDAFITSRAFGSSSETVSESGSAFARGLESGGVQGTGKHFPGLGGSETNTDDAATQVPAGDLEPFEAAIGEGLGLVMLSNAVHTELDPRDPAFASAEIAALLREDLGFDGVTITDDLGAGAVRARFDRDGAAVAAAGAGTDLFLFALSESPGVLDALVGAAERGAIEPATLESSCVRVAALRDDLGS